MFGGWKKEFADLFRPELYVIDPENAWKRLKTKNVSAKYLAVFRQVAHFREERAQQRNVPRNRILSDKALAELSSVRPAESVRAGKMPVVAGSPEERKICTGTRQGRPTGQGRTGRRLACPDLGEKTGDRELRDPRSVAGPLEGQCRQGPRGAITDCNDCGSRKDRCGRDMSSHFHWLEERIIWPRRQASIERGNRAHVRARQCANCRVRN